VPEIAADFRGRVIQVIDEESSDATRLTTVR
jgi:hypothetical protein